MDVVGLVLAVRPSSFKGRNNENIEMLYLDIYDDSAGLVNCEMRKPNGALPEKDMRVEAKVRGLKSLNFGNSKISVVLSEWSPLGVVPISYGGSTPPPPPMSSTGKK